MLAFAIVSFLMFLTPGPGVMSLAGVGAAFGWRQGLLYMAGLFTGNVFVSLAVITGLAAIILAEPLCAQYYCSAPLVILGTWLFA
jgi:threonine/homoserine/homoserine lactone efflux protein